MFGDRIFKEIIKVQCSHNSGVLNPEDGVLKRRGGYTRDLFIPTPHVHKEAIGGCFEKAALCKPGKELSLHTNPAGPLILGL